MKKLLVLILALSLTFTAGCKKAEEKKDSPVKENSAVTESGKEVNENQPAEKKAEEKKPSANVDTKSIKSAEDIKTTDQLEALINETNEESTDPQRKEEVLEILGEYLNSIEGEVITAPEN